MKQHNQTIALAAALLALGTGLGSAATINMTVSNGDWNASVWGSPAAAPTSGNDYVVFGDGGTTGAVLVRMPSGSASSTFGGDSLSLVNGGRGLLKSISSTATINGSLTLDFGWLQLGPNSPTTATLSATQLIVNGTGNRINNGFSGQRFIIDAELVGSGDLTLDYGQGTDAGGRDVVFNNVGSYTGAISVIMNADLEFVGNVTFGGSVSLTDNGTLRVLSGQTLTFHAGALSDEVNGTVAPGTYTGASLDALGANYANDGGTLIVGASTFPLTITPNGANPGNYDFTWDSQDGKLYDLVSATDFSTAISTWPVWDGRSDLAAAPPTNTLADIPGGGDPKRFFAVVEKDPPPPPLLNGSFEDPVKADGEFTLVPPPHWTEFDAGNLGDVGVWNPLVGEHATVPDGENVGQVYHTGVPMAAFGLSQMLGANFAANTAYQVAVEVGRSASFAWPGYRVELWAGATMLKADANTLTPAADSWATSTVSYTYDAGDAGLVGEPLEIRLLSIGEDPNGTGAGSNFSVEFDSVTFTATGP